jgi:hypothetical protein
VARNTLPVDGGPRVVTIQQSKAADLLRRLRPEPTLAMAPVSPSDGECVAGASSLPIPSPTENRWNAMLGCKTSEVASALLAQVVKLEHPAASYSEEHMHTLLVQAAAMLAELEPQTATQALLAAQMVGAQRLAMTFMERATLEGQTVAGADASVLRATRLMRVFMEQVETMARLKGKSGQQRVVVEHVTVAAGGQAIVGTVHPGGRGTSGTDR